MLIVCVLMCLAIYNTSLAARSKEADLTPLIAHHPGVGDTHEKAPWGSGSGSASGSGQQVLALAGCLPPRYARAGICWYWLPWCPPLASPGQWRRKRPLAAGTSRVASWLSFRGTKRNRSPYQGRWQGTTSSFPPPYLLCPASLCMENLAWAWPTASLVVPTAWQGTGKETKC